MKEKRQDVEHMGVVMAITNGIAEVQIIQNSACSACHAKGACSASDSAEKLVNAYTNGKSFSVGQQVLIIGRSVLGMEAAVYAYLIPFVILFMTMLLVYEYTQNEMYAALAAIGSLIPFYSILYLFKNKLSKKFSFFIKQIIS